VALKSHAAGGVFKSELSVQPLTFVN